MGIVSSTKVPKWQFELLKDMLSFKLHFKPMPERQAQRLKWLYDKQWFIDESFESLWFLTLTLTSNGPFLCPVAHCHSKKRMVIVWLFDLEFAD